MKTHTVDPNATREERDAAIQKICKALFRTLKTLERAEPQKSAKHDIPAPDASNALKSLN
jgi:hypothetical protein